MAALDDERAAEIVIDILRRSDRYTDRESVWGAGQLKRRLAGGGTMDFGHSASSPTSLIFDLSRLRFMDSAGIARADWCRRRR